MISVNKISRSYGKIRALDEVSFETKDGELFGLIGPDGAGKTTLFRILATLLLPDKGSAVLAGHDAVSDYKSLRRHIGYMPARFSLYPDLTVEENLHFFATVFDSSVEENYDLVKDIYSQIEPFRKRRAAALSGGMKQKLALSCALIHRPKILLLDEPTTGVDPVSRKEFWEILKGLQGSGITMLVSTPFMDEAAECERIALINKGKILAIDSPDGIRDSFSKELFAVSSDRDMYSLLNDLRQSDAGAYVFAFGENVHYARQNSTGLTDSLTAYLSGHNHKDIRIEQIRPGIEDRFIELMAHE